MRDQIIHIIETERLTPAKFADEIGVQRSSISHILSGRNKPSYDFILKILTRFSNVNAEWLITGKGSMIKGQTAVMEQNLAGELFSRETNYQVKNPDNTPGKSKDKQKEMISYTQEKELYNNIKKESITEFTNVNDINLIVIFYKDGTCERFSIRE